MNDEPKASDKRISFNAPPGPSIYEPTETSSSTSVNSGPGSGWAPIDDTWQATGVEDRELRHPLRLVLDRVRESDEAD